MKRILEIFAWTTLAASAAASAQEPVVRIGVVIDGPWERNVEIERIIQRELTELMQGEFEFETFSAVREIHSKGHSARCVGADAEAVAGIACYRN